MLDRSLDQMTTAHQARTLHQRPRARTRPCRILTLGIVISALTAGTAVAYPARLNPHRGAYIGAHAAPRGGESNTQAYVRYERTIGRKTKIHHQYYKWDSAIPLSLQDWDRQTGRIPFLNWAALRTNGSFVPWGEIANGSQDRWIAQRARDFKRFGKPIYLTFQHEPENNVPQFGTPYDFAAAFRRIVTVFRQERVRNVAFVWTMMAWSFDPKNMVANMYYPGDKYVDFVASDGYNWYGVRSGERWRHFQSIFQGTRRFAHRHRKPWIVAEFGAIEDPSASGRKANWIRQTLPAMRRWPDLAAVLYFDSIKSNNHWAVDSSGSATRAFHALAGASYFRR